MWLIASRLSVLHDVRVHVHGDADLGVPEDLHHDAGRDSGTSCVSGEDYYNYHRPHGALDGQTRYERLIARTRAEVSPGS